MRFPIEMQKCIETVFLSLTINLLLLLNQFETSEIVLFTASFCKEHSRHQQTEPFFPFLIDEGISFTYNRRRIGPKIEPCGTPCTIGKELEYKYVMSFPASMVFLLFESDV